MKANKAALTVEQQRYWEEMYMYAGLQEVRTPEFLTRIEEEEWRRGNHWRMIYLARGVMPYHTENYVPGTEAFEVSA